MEEVKSSILLRSTTKTRQPSGFCVARQGHLLIIATVLLAGYSAFFSNYHSASLFLALAATFATAKEVGIIWHHYRIIHS